MPVHDWTRVSAGTFHDFHNSWITHLRDALNTGILPPGYYAQSDQRARDAAPDILTLQTGNGAPTTISNGGTIAVAEAPPQVSLLMVPDEQATYRRARRTLTIRHASDNRIVALMEIVSPANKDRASSVEDFVDKALSAMQLGYHLLIIDLLPPGPSDPQGMHGAIWEHFAREGYDPPADRPLTLASYEVKNQLPNAYVQPLAVGDALPEMPLFLEVGHYVQAPLGRTYDNAYRGGGEFLREAVEAKREA